MHRWKENVLHAIGFFDEKTFAISRPVNGLSEKYEIEIENERDLLLLTRSETFEPRAHS